MCWQNLLPQDQDAELRVRHQAGLKMSSLLALTFARLGSALDSASRRIVYPIAWLELFGLGARLYISGRAARLGLCGLAPGWIFLA